MSLRVTGYLDGRPQYRDEGESRARVSGYGGSALGHTITVVLTEAQRQAERLRAEKRTESRP